MTNQANKYRFNDATGEVHELNAEGDACYFLCHYIKAGIKGNMREATKLKKMSEFMDKALLKELNSEEGQSWN